MSSCKPSCGSSHRCLLLPLVCRHCVGLNTRTPITLPLYGSEIGISSLLK